LSGVSELIYLLTWAVVLTLFNVARLLYVLMRLKSSDFLDNPQREARNISVGLLITSVVLALGYLCFASRAPVLEQYVVTAIAVGLCAGAAVVFTGCRSAFLAYTLPFLVVVTGIMLWHGVMENDALRRFIGLLLVIFALSIVKYQASLERNLLSNIRLRFEKDELLAELHALNQELSADRDAFLTASLTDGLTGLANRRHFDRTLSREWDRCRRDGVSFACIMLDIDHFKHFNDLYGHMAGDNCLRTVANIIGTTVGRGGDFAARYGGEEFVVLLPGTDGAGAHVIAERIRRMIEERGIAHEGGGSERVVTLSAGVASLIPSEQPESAQSLVDSADEALYQAKKGGRNRVVERGSIIE
jgi:diguanylate cyclase (GGDEF)-like protein